MVVQAYFKIVQIFPNYDVVTCIPFGLIVKNVCFVFFNILKDFYDVGITQLFLVYPQVYSRFRTPDLKI